MKEFSIMEYNHVPGLFRKELDYFKDHEDWSPKGFKSYVFTMLVQWIASIHGVAKLNEEGYKLSISYFKDNYIIAGYDSRDLKRTSNYLIKKSTEDGWIDKYMHDFRQKSSELGKFIDKIHKKEIKKDELKELFLELVEKCVKANAYSYITESTLVTKDEYWVTKRFKELDDSLTSDDINILLTPHFKSFITEYHEDLTKLNSEEILKKWCWIKSTYFKLEPLTLEEIENDRRNTEKITSTSPDLSKYNSDTLVFSNFLNKLTQLQDERKMNVLKTNFALNKIFEAISKECGISKDIILNSTHQEIINFIDGKTVEKEGIIRRGKESVWIVMNNEFEITTDRNSIDIVKKMFKNETGEVKGYCASKGKAKGPARIIMSTEDFHKMRKGDILVTSMTRPEFIPLMKQASGIITDEGGVTCHAAILSRELNKPCIIGTGVATKILKDGDLVEVDADKGVVKVLK